MNIYHIVFAIAYVVLMISCVLLKGRKKLFVIVPMLLFAAFCSFDYAVTQFRGIGFVKTDFDSWGVFIDLIKRIGFPGGKKYILCIVWLVAMIIFTLVSKKLSYKISVVVIITSGLLVFAVTDYPTEAELFRGNKTFPVLKTSDSENWYERDEVVCHALGSVVDGTTLTNSYEALSFNYARGFRTFETDIVFTSDGVPVLRHDWSSDLGQADDFGWNEELTWAPTLDLFLASPIYDKYTPMTLCDLFEFMQSHEDMYLVFDTKLNGEISTTEQYSIISEYAINNGYENVLDRTVVQLYYYSMYEEVEDAYTFKNYLLTLYVMGWREDVVDFLKKKDIRVLTVPEGYDVDEISKSLEGTGIHLYTHTIDEPRTVKSSIERGAYGVYTDWYTPYEFNKLKKEYLR